MKKFQVTSALASALMLAGCGLIKTSSSTSTTTPSGTTSSSSSSSSPDDSSGGDVSAMSNNDRLRGLFIREDFAQVKGLPLEQAKAKAKALGHDGKVEVHDMRTFRQGCADGIVCEATDEREGSSGMSDHDTLYLWVNPKLAIEGPPPD